MTLAIDDIMSIKFVEEDSDIRGGRYAYLIIRLKNGIRNALMIYDIEENKFYHRDVRRPGRYKDTIATYIDKYNIVITVTELSDCDVVTRWNTDEGCMESIRVVDIATMLEAYIQQYKDAIVVGNTDIIKF